MDLSIPPYPPLEPHLRWPLVVWVPFAVQSAFLRSAVTRLILRLQFYCLLHPFSAPKMCRFNAQHRQSAFFTLPTKNCKNVRFPIILATWDVIFRPGGTREFTVKHGEMAAWSPEWPVKHNMFIKFYDKYKKSTFLLFTFLLLFWCRFGVTFSADFRVPPGLFFSKN